MLRPHRRLIEVIDHDRNGVVALPALSVLATDQPLADYDGPEVATSNDYAAQFPIKIVHG